MTATNSPLQHHPYAADLALLLANNSAIQAAWVDNHENPTTLTLCTNGVITPRHIASCPRLKNLTLRMHSSQTFKTLEAPLEPIDASNAHQLCQDEPIKLGTQIQPARAPWVGTAGAAVRWIDALENHRWGILSNWHVMVPESENTPTPQHQPTDVFPKIASLIDASRVNRNARNTIDAAIADALVDGKHSISNEILGIGPLDQPPTSATVGLPVQKAGRTTQVTRARCTAVGAAVRVGYADFTADFVDQDLYESTGTPFSAAGDSGSLICTLQKPAPVSLLFAGGGNLTIGNPYRHVVKRFNLQHPFN